MFKHFMPGFHGLKIRLPHASPWKRSTKCPRSNYSLEFQKKRAVRSLLRRRTSLSADISDVGVGLFSRLLLRKAAPMQTELDTETCLILTGLRNSVGARFEEPRWKLFYGRQRKKFPVTFFYEKASLLIHQQVTSLSWCLLLRAFELI